MDTYKVIVEKLVECKDLATNFIVNDSIKINVVNSLNQIINRLNFLTGNIFTNPKPKKFEPVTNFMGEDLEIRKPIEPIELSPDEQRRKDFLNKIEKLESVFLTKNTSKILESNPLPEDQLVIRGIAKRAGLDDYKTAEINAEYIDLIKEGIKEQKKIVNDYKKVNESIEIDEDID